MQKRHSHDAEAAQRQLPVLLPPIPDELLSSWISRHAAFYAVPPLLMLRHCLPEVRSLRVADLHLSEDQEIRLAKVFFTAPADIRRMTFANVPSSFHRFIAARPVQRCTNCNPIQAAPLPVLRDQLTGWRITCLRCGTSFETRIGTEPPPRSDSITARPCGARSCSTMRSSTASDVGLHRPRLPVFCSCGG